MGGNNSNFTDNTRCNQEDNRIRRYNRTLEGINQILINVVQAKTEEELGNACLSVAMEVTGSQFGFVGEVRVDGLLHDIAISDMGWEKCQMYDKAGHRRPPGDFVLHGLYGLVIDTGKGFFTNHPQSHPDSIGLPQGNPPLTSFLGVPLILNGKTMGMIAVANREGGYSFEQQEDLEAIAPAVMQALHKKRDEKQKERAEEALRESEARLSVDLAGMRRLYELHSRLSSETDLNIALDEILAAAVEFMGTERGTVQLVSDDGERLEIVAHRGYDHGNRFIEHFRYEGSKPACDVARRQRQRLIIEDIETFSALTGTRDLEVALADGIRATQSTPMITRKGEVVGVLSTQFTRPHRPSVHELQLIDLLAWTAANFIERHRAEVERARTDEALRVSEEKYHSLFNSIDEGFNLIEVIFDDSGKPVDHRILEANLSQEKMTGLKDVVGKRARELLPDFEDYWIENFGQVAITGKPVRLENRIEGLDRWFDVYASRVGGEGSRKVAVIFNDITQRKRAEEALRQSEERLNFALETIHTGAWDLDLVSNDSPHRSLEHDRIFGYEQPLQNWTYEMFLDHVLPEDRAMVDEKFQKAVTSGSDWSFECRIRRVDGVVRWIWAAGRQQVDAAGTVRRMAGIVQDITERKRAEEALRESEERLRLLSDNLPDSALYQYVFEPDGSAHFQYFSAGIEKLNGINVSDVFRDPGILHRQIPPDYLERLLEAEACSARELSDFDMDVPMQLPDGQIRWMRLHSRPRRLPDGRTIWDGVQADITERKKIEEALKIAHETLEEKVKERTAELEKAYRSLSESEKSLSEAQKMAHIGNWDLDLATGEIYWSDELYRIFGLVPQEVNLVYDRIYNYVHPNDRDYVKKFINEVLNGRSRDIDYRITLDNGEERLVHTHGEIIFGENGYPSRVRGTIQDITERSRAEKALEKLNKIRIKEIHHRIKNNLQVISSMLDLQSEKFRDKNVLEAFRESQNRVISMSLIHEELYKGEETDKLNFSIYIKMLAEKLFQTYRLHNKNICLSMDLEENSYFDMDTAIPLGIIINELVSNSLKHAFAEKQEGEIRIKLCKEAEESNEMNEHSYSLTVSDNGKGVPEDMEVEGAETLGLQLVAILVDQLDGKIELKREQGTEFRITFDVNEKCMLPD